MRKTSFVFAIACCVASIAHAQSSAKRPLDHEVYDSWNQIRDQQLSDDGRWVLYALVPQDGDAELHVRSVASTTTHVVARGRSAQFSAEGGFVVFLIKPELTAQREAKKEKKKPDDQPKDSLGILNLGTGEITRVERVKSFAVPDDAGAWVAYLLEKAVKEGEEDDTTEAEEQEPAEPKEPEPEEEAQEEEEDKKKDKKDGTTLVLRNLNSGEEQQFDLVMEYAFAADGEFLAYATSSKDGSLDGAYAVETATGTVLSLLEGEGNYKALTVDESSEQLAFLADRDDYEADQPAFALYHWRNGARDARMLAGEGTAGIPEGWWVGEHGELSFSENGQRLFFGTAPRPAPEPEEETPEWEEVKVDIWNWKDLLLQPMQLVQRDEELKRTYRAVVHLGDARVVQLADEAVPEVEVIQDGDGDVALGFTNVPYRQLISWDTPGYLDIYLVDINSGSRRLIRERLQGSRFRVSLSPEGKYVSWWDGHERAWFVASASGGEPVNVTAALPHPIYNELHDWPMIPSSYGTAGWTEGDGWYLVYDRYDIWAVDPSGRRAPMNITEGMGRERNVQFRYVRLDPEQEAIPERDPILLSAFDRTTKTSGFYRDRIRGSDRPRQLVMQDRRLGPPRKAEDGDVLLFTRQSFQEFPDLWVSDLSLGDMRKMSDANPQQAEYRWGTAELVHWRSTDGKPLQGILYKPEDFDPSRQYPMMVYFYEKMSDGLHSYRSPGPGSSSISVSFYVSRGYVVFIPDIHYRVGYPGESAMDCVVSGVLSVLENGFVDPDRVGVQGHSWGGYQIAYLVTQTNIFRAAEAGAPVSNMTSAYGGIRWGSGMSRMFQYERSQSRIGGTLWDARPRYLANSPLFWADKIETPVLMLHNDEDGAVPWYQGIEFFVALRRLGKPAWMLNYNGEPHGLRKYPNKKDWAIRMQQFFDHYLQDAPPPVWLAEGVPAVEKGRTRGLELVEPEPTTGGGSGSR
jgi:dipeptidyl aminopeptidase/acylaminoacyl peptidase